MVVGGAASEVFFPHPLSMQAKSAIAVQAKRENVTRRPSFI
jgi:hypothetical protein